MSHETRGARKPWGTAQKGVGHMRRAAETADGMDIRRVRGTARRRRKAVGAQDSGWLGVRRASRLGAFALIVLGLWATSALVGPTGCSRFAG